MENFNEEEEGDSLQSLFPEMELTVWEEFLNLGMHSHGDGDDWWPQRPLQRHMAVEGSTGQGELQGLVVRAEDSVFSWERVIGK